MLTKNGFTLIEILVVLTIIGITIGFALLAFGDFGASRRLVAGVEQFSNQVQLIQQQAMLESSTFGIQLEPTGYHVLRFTPPSSWQRLTADEMLRAHAFPARTLYHLESTSPKQRPSIIIYATGDLSPFTLTFGLDKQPEIISVISLGDGTLSLKRHNKP